MVWDFEIAPGTGMTYGDLRNMRESADIIYFKYSNGDYRMFSYENVVNELKAGVCEVTFKKLDGTTRVMCCTLKKELLPEGFNDTVAGSMLTEGDGKHEVIAVWDLGSNGWRSFRVDSITGFMKAP